MVHSITRRGVRHTIRLLHICMLLAVIVASGLFQLVAAQSTPYASPTVDDNIRLYVGHGAQLTAEIPVYWTPDRSLKHDYAGRVGFISSAPLTAFDHSLNSLEAACDVVAMAKPFSDEGETKPTTWRELPACVVRTSGDSELDPVSLVFAHPDPAPDTHNTYVAVTLDAAHFDEIVATISFDPAKVTPAAYLDATIDFSMTHSLWRDAIDWEEVRAEAHARLIDIETGQQMLGVYPSIDYVIEQIHLAGGDGHNYFIHSADAASFASSVLDTDRYIAPTGSPLPGGIGYVSIPGFSAGDEQAARFMSEIHSIIASQVDHSNCGWIVDLRGNTGGDMHPMIGGLAPLLQPGELIRFRDANGDEISVSFHEDGSFEEDGEPIASMPLDTAPSDPELLEQPLAVLTGPRTVSSGEATALSFSGREQTRFFGEPTLGFTTSPTYLYLFDGSLLSLATWWMVGPQGAIYPDGIFPDVAVSPSSIVQPLSDDPVVQAASDWLRQHPDCEDNTATPAVHRKTTGQ